MITPGDLQSQNVQALILSSDSYEDELWAKTADLRASGVPVMRLYGHEW